MKKLYRIALGLLLAITTNISHAQIADLGVVGINSPLTPICASKPVLVVSLYNYSAVDHFFGIDGARIVVDVTGASTQSFSLTINSGTLTAGTSAQYIVANPVDLTVSGTHHFDATVHIISGLGDVDTTNNAFGTYDVLVNPLPVVTLDTINPICLNTPLLTLTNGAPIGGTYSGNGVSGGVFSPTVAGAGYTNITYIYTDTNGCTAQKSRYLLVNTPPVVSHSSLAAVCSTATAFTLSGGTPVGGVYSGTGVSGGQFDPSLSGLGTFSVNYVYTDANGCKDSLYIPQTVYAAPPVVFSSINPVCVNSPSLTLSTGVPIGGTYSGTSVTDSTFNPVTAGLGTHTLTYTYTDLSGCTDSATQTITVSGLPTVSHSALADACENSGTITLTGGSPSGGVYRGLGAADSSFTPSVPGVGTFTLTYIYADTIGCTDSTYIAITVNGPPVVTLGSLSNICVTASSFSLTGGSPSGGSFFGTGVSAGMFDPSAAGAGTHTLSYTYTDPSTTCRDTASKPITVIALPTQEVDDTAHCGGTPLTLNAGNPGAGYLWSTGATTQSIVLTTTDTISVTVSYGSGCFATFTATATFLTPPLVDLGEDVVGCENSNIILSACAGGWASHLWSSGSTTCSYTVPSTGSYHIIVTDSNGCTGTDTVNVTKHPLPSVNFSLSTSFLCLNASALTLSGGSPAGGIYSGPGVSSGMFDPALAGAGTHTITYTFTDTATNCPNSASQIIAVGCVGIEKNVQANTVLLFPNPAHSVLNVMQDADLVNQRIVISDMQGKVVYDKWFDVIYKTDVISINISDFSSGIYFIMLQNNNETKTTRFAVQH